jgi:hypothetical protein
LHNVEVYRGVKRGARNGVDTTALFDSLTVSIHSGLSRIRLVIQYRSCFSLVVQFSMR